MAIPSGHDPLPPSSDKGPSVGAPYLQAGPKDGEQDSNSEANSINPVVQGATGGKSNGVTDTKNTYREAATPLPDDVPASNTP
ncbi:unnamed protein product [Phytophthora lilii]|uniref:Unnamed protein product n=1 Tax=Phytophthora lilii TaxID=2077276 RepID=A0A9W6XG77_9STRA|nr:unnamed protein product [Phytophthora lilii]